MKKKRKKKHPFPICDLTPTPPQIAVYIYVSNMADHIIHCGLDEEMTNAALADFAKNEAGQYHQSIG